MMKKRSITMIFCVIVFLATIIGIMFMFVDALTPEFPSVESWYRYKVKDGDTLWDITPLVDGYDIRDLINVVKEHNNLSNSGLTAGDVIELPVWGV